MTLEHDLRTLAEAFPETPALAQSVLTAVGRASARRRRRRLAGAFAFALVLLVPATALAVSPDLRQRVLDTFGLRSVRIERVAQLPSVAADARRLELGTRVSLQRAQAALGARVRPPGALGAPDAIFEDRLQRGVDVTFLYEPRTVAERLGPRERVLVSTVRGTLDKQVLGKTLAQATRVKRLRIDGGPALLVTGAPHIVVLFRRGNALDATSTRLAGTTLLWQKGDLLVRVEGDLPESRLVAIARSLSSG
jgi:hypothetical protein